MFTVDEIIKLILAISFSFSLVLVAFQISRFIGALANAINDIRETLRNINIASGFMVEDYDRIRGFLHNSGNIFSVAGQVIKPLQSIVGFFTARGNDDKSDLREEKS